jgi:tetratricopeptide (TPR) repeat protein
MVRILGAALAPSLLVALAGCAAFRADVGYGTGLGAAVSVPAIVHTGLGGGQFTHLGHNYCDGWHVGNPSAPGYDVDAEYELVLAHWSEARNGIAARTERGAAVPIRSWPPSQHACFFVPVLAHPEDGSSYALEVSVALLVVDLRLGFDPWYWFHDELWGEGESAAVREEAEAWLSEGIARNDEGKAAEALDALKKARAIARGLARAKRPPQDWFARVACEEGRALLALGRGEEALDAFARAIAEEPAPACFAARAFALYTLGRLDEALAGAETALEWDAECGDAYVVRSLVRATRGDREGARLDAVKALTPPASMLARDPAALVAYRARLEARGVESGDSH